MKITKPGIYRGIDVAAYHDDPCPEPSLSQSIAKVLRDYSPLHAAAKHPRLSTPAPPDEDEEPEKYVKAKVIGDAAHALMIGRGKTLAIGQFDSWRGKEPTAFKDAARAAGKIAILDRHYKQAGRLVDAAAAQLRRHEEADALTQGAGEVALIWREGETWFRCLVDWLHDDLRAADDYKTTGMSVAPHLLGLRAEAGGWHVQAAMIERGLDALDPKGAGRRKYRFVAQEQDAPHALNVMVMTEQWLTMGRKQLAYAVGIWNDCMATGQWPGYLPRAVRPEFPGYREQQWLTREIEAAEREPQNVLEAG